MPQGVLDAEEGAEGGSDDADKRGEPDRNVLLAGLWPALGECRGERLEVPVVDDHTDPPPQGIKRTSQPATRVLDLAGERA